MPQSKACKCDDIGSGYETRDYTSMVHDNDPTWLDDGLHDRDGPDSVRDTATSISNHGRIYETTLEWSSPVMASNARFE